MFRPSLSIAAALALAGAALGQHAQLVLFGDPNPAGVGLPPEQLAVHPVSSPYYHEDAFITSDVRAWFVYHDFPTDIALAGGEAYTPAVQVRLALLPELQFVAYKDGWLFVDTPALEDDGLVDVAAGLKYAVIQDFESQFHWAIGAGYEVAVGDKDVLQDDDEFRVWTSVNKGFDALHLGGTFNAFFAPDHAKDNGDRISWHLHADYHVNEWFSPVVEVNGYHMIDSGTSPFAFHGADVLNLGTGEGDPVITAAPGAEFRIFEGLGLRGAVEFPLTDNTDIFGWRITTSIVYSF